MNAARRDDTCLFQLAGEFDLSNVWQVEDALLTSIRTEQRDIVVDLSDVEFMDGQLVRALVKARAAAVHRDVSFVVIRPRADAVGRVAELVDFDLAA
jgi:anti-anti-sigma factor